MTVRVLICDPLSEEAIKILKNKGFILDFADSPPPDQLANIIKGYDAIIVRSATKVTREVIDAGVNLKIIARAGTGLDNIDVKYAQKKNIAVINSPEGNANAVAELTIGLIFALLRMIPQAYVTLKEKKWMKRQFKGIELAGRTVGVIGLGNIGSIVALKLKCLGASVIGFKKHNVKEKARKLGIHPAKSLDSLLKESDIVTLHVPLTDETRHMIDYREFDLMKDEVYLVNTARGAIINGKALLENLNKGKVAGAALDVFENEPPKEPWEWELVRHPKVIAVPHIGAMTKEAQKKVGITIAKKLIEYFSRYV